MLTTTGDSKITHFVYQGHIPLSHFEIQDLRTFCVNLNLADWALIRFIGWIRIREIRVNKIRVNKIRVRARPPSDPQIVTFNMLYKVDYQWLKHMVTTDVYHGKQQ